ncbi:MAG TPA: hypothetical protein VHF06_02250 [Pseudonocardiaceae bacterium]|nr:hypothetical protein [Pseudonocardiaceae bacterium]
MRTEFLRALDELAGRRVFQIEQRGTFCGIEDVEGAGRHAASGSGQWHHSDGALTSAAGEQQMEHLLMHHLRAADRHAQRILMDEDRALRGVGAGDHIAAAQPDFEILLDIGRIDQAGLVEQRADVILGLLSGRE